MLATKYGHFKLKIIVIQTQVIQRVDNAIHWINRYPVNSIVCFVSTYPLDIQEQWIPDSDLSGG